MENNPGHLLELHEHVEVPLVFDQRLDRRLDKPETLLDLTHHEMLWTWYFLNNFVRVLDLRCGQLHKSLSIECMRLVDLPVHKQLFGASVQLRGNLKVSGFACGARRLNQSINDFLDCFNRDFRSILRHQSAVGH